MTNFNQFSENSCQNANNFQTSNIFSIPLHDGQELKNTEIKILPGNFTQFQPQSQVKTVGLESRNPFGVQQTACSKTITENVPIAHPISTFPPQAQPSLEQNPESRLPHSHQFSSVLHPISNERFRHPSFEIDSLPWISNTAPYWQNPTSKRSIKIPPRTIQNFNGNPLKYHEWINDFFCLVHNNTSITDTHRITYLQYAVTGKAKDVIQAYSCDPAYYSTALNELMSCFGDPTIVVNAFINQLENWKSTNDYNKQNFVAFPLFLKRLVQAFQYLGYTADLQSSTLMKKAKEKVPHNILLKWTEYTVTSIKTQATLVEFQKWLEVQAHVYDKINRETFQQNNFRRNNFNSSGNMNNSDSHERNLSTQSSGFPAQPTNGNHSTTISSSGTPKPPSAPPFPALNNANQPKRSCEKCRGNHILATCPDYQKCSPSQQFDIVSKSNLCSNCLSNKHKKQNCPSTKRCQICSGYHHTTLHDPGKIIKRPSAAFSTSNSTGTSVTNQASQLVKQQCQPGSNNNASASSKSQKSRYGQSFANNYQNQFQRANLNNANQSFSVNHLQSIFSKRQESFRYVRSDRSRKPIYFHT